MNKQKLIAFLVIAWVLAGPWLIHRFTNSYSCHYVTVLYNRYCL